MSYYRNNSQDLPISNKKFFKANEGAILFSMGIHTFERIGKEANAKYKIGKSALYNIELINDYMERFNVKE